jgi:hypothetical protein
LQVLDSKIEKINENGLTGNYNVVSNTSQVGDDKETKIKDFVTKPGDSSGSGTAEATVTVVQAPVAAPVITPIQIRSVVSMPPVPQGAQVQTQTKDGQPLPSWVKFDPVTGVLSGTPPPDFKGSLDVVIKVPQAGGGVQEITTTFGAGN